MLVDGHGVAPQMFDRTLLTAPPMLSVVSARRTIAGFGGIGGVWTVFVMVVDPPGASVTDTRTGSTPGVVAPARGAPWRTEASKLSITMTMVIPRDAAVRTFFPIAAILP
jgi:hypothetical protein